MPTGAYAAITSPQHNHQPIAVHGSIGTTAASYVCDVTNGSADGVHAKRMKEMRQRSETLTTDK